MFENYKKKSIQKKIRVYCNNLSKKWKSYYQIL